MNKLKIRTVGLGIMTVLTVSAGVFSAFLYSNALSSMDGDYITVPKDVNAGRNGTFGGTLVVSNTGDAGEAMLIKKGQLTIQNLSGTSNTSALIVEKGRVGLGTLAPNTELNISNSASGPIVNLQGADTNYRGLKIADTANTEKWFVGSDSSNRFVIRKDATTNALTVDSNGNVGIGSFAATNPKTTLHVAQSVGTMQAVNGAYYTANIYSQQSYVVEGDGSASNPYKASIFGEADYGRGVYGYAQNGYGVRGGSKYGYGIYGVSEDVKSAVLGWNTRTQACAFGTECYGVYGLSQVSSGVAGRGLDGGRFETTSTVGYNLKLPSRDNGGNMNTGMYLFTTNAASCGADSVEITRQATGLYTVRLCAKAFGG